MRFSAVTRRSVRGTTRLENPAQHELIDVRDFVIPLFDDRVRIRESRHMPMPSVCASFTIAGTHAGSMRSIDLDLPSPRAQ